MAAAASAKQQSGRTKGRKNRIRNFFFSWGCCGGGVSSRVVSATDCGDGKKSVKHGKDSSVRVTKAKDVLTEDPMMKSPEKTSSSREIHVVRAEKRKNQILGQPLPGQAVNYKTWNMFLDKDNKQIRKSGPAINSKTQQIDSQNGRLISARQGRSYNPTATPKPSQSASLPPATQGKKDKGRADEGSRTGQESSEVDSMVGAVIITVTLIVMLIGGKACAILCTAAWLYFVPHLQIRANVGEFTSAVRTKDDVVDLDSLEYKNKVVLRGLLERSSNQHL